MNPDKIESLRQAYLNKKKREKRIVCVIQVLILIGFLGLWELASGLLWIDPLLFSSPSAIGQLFITKVMDFSIFPHIAITVIETFASFILGTLLGLAVAIILWWSPMFAKICDPYLVSLNAMPKIALGPIMIVIFGTGMASAIAMGIIICIVVTIIVIYNAFEEVDENYLKVLHTFHATKTQIFKEAIFPASLPTIISTLKVNVGLAWVGVIVGEFFVSKSGLGFLIVYSFQVFNFTLVLLSVLIILVIAALMYALVDCLEKYLLKKLQRN